MVHPKTDTAQMYVDIGIYGVPQRKFDAKPVTRRIESLVSDCDGFQMLYAGKKLICAMSNWCLEEAHRGP